jgi:predicted ATPase/transcriptional regulator with XRE-family HTH domain
MSQLEFSVRLRKLRTARDLTQEALAELAGCATQTLRAFEAGRRRPSQEMAERLAEVLHIPEAEWDEFVLLARGWQRITNVHPPPPAPAPAPNQSRLLAPVLLIGRAHEIAEVTNLLQQPATRLVTLVGPGGIGKTVLAIQVASNLQGSFRDGTLLIAFAANETTNAALHTIATALAIPLASDQSLTEQIVAACVGQERLLLFDNLEHLLGDNLLVELLARLGQEAPRIKILATSRERLQLTTERVIVLGGLELPANDKEGAVEHSAAVLLFVERARRMQIDFTLDRANQAAVVRICRLLGGMPLAIELAASWISILTPDEIAAEIERDLDFLALANRDMPEQHRSMRVVFERSWQLLTADEQATLARMALFRGGCTREAIFDVVLANLALLASLVRKSLVQRVGDRYVLHELIRQYSLEQLAQLELDNVSKKRYVDYILTLVWRVEREFAANGDQHLRTLIKQELDNIRAALLYGLEVAKGEVGAQIFIATAFFFVNSGLLRESLNWIQRFLAVVHNPALRTQLLMISAGLGHSEGNWQLALAQAEKDLVLLQQGSRPEELAVTYTFASFAYLDICAYDKAIIYTNNAYSIYEQQGLPSRAIITRCNLGYIEGFAGYYGPARDHLNQAYTSAQALNDRLNIAHALYGLAFIDALEGDPAGLGKGSQALHIFYEYEHMILLSYCLHAQAALLGLNQSWSAAAQILGFVDTLRTNLGIQITPGMKAAYERLLGFARGTVEQAAFEQAYRAGERLTIEQVLALAHP